MGNKNFTDVTKPSEIVQLLLNDEQLAALNTSTPTTSHGAIEGTTNQAGPMQDLWNDEEDNFFGHSGTLATAAASDAVDPDTPIPSTRVKKRKSGATGTTRGRKPAAKKNPEKGTTRKSASVKQPAA